MDMQGQRFFSTREFRIAVIAIAAVAALAVGAYLFGSGLQADTSASVAPSPLGSSLTAVRESPSLDYVGRLISASEASRAAALAALAKSGADFHADQSNAAAAASRADSSGRLISAAAADRLTALAALAESRSDFHADQSNAAAANQYQNSWMGFTAPDSVEIKPSATSGAASLAGLAERWAPFYAGLDKAMTAAGARSAQGSSSSIVESSTDQQFQWIKPEGIKPSEGSGSEAGLQWIKPEGIGPK